MAIHLLQIYGIIAIILGFLYGLSLTDIIDSHSRAILIRVRFLLTLECILSVGTLIIWKLASKFTHYRSPHKFHFSSKCLYGILFILCFGSHLSWFTNYIVSAEPNFISMFCYSCLGIYVQLVVFLIVTVCAEIFFSFLINKYSTNSSNPNPKVFLKGAFWIIGIIYSTTLGAFGLYNTQIRYPEIRTVNLKVQNFPEIFAGLKIVQLNDIHLGPTVGKSRLENIVKTVNKIGPDILVVVGDLTDGSVERLSDASKPLEELHSVYGKYYVTGNHEYYTGDADNWLKHMEKMGFISLHNKNHIVRHKNSPLDYFYIAGTDDIHAKLIGYAGHGFDIDKAVRDCDEDHPIILLTHQPKAAKIALDSGYRNIELVLSGHTHGGQLFPMTLLYCWLNPFCLGLYEYNGKLVYVSEGTQYWGIPMRILTRMEITVLNLYPK